MYGVCFGLAGPELLLKRRQENREKEKGKINVCVCVRKGKVLKMV